MWESQVLFEPEIFPSLILLSLTRFWVGFLGTFSLSLPVLFISNFVLLCWKEIPPFVLIWWPSLFLYQAKFFLNNDYLLFRNFRVHCNKSLLDLNPLNITRPSFLISILISRYVDIEIILTTPSSIALFPRKFGFLSLQSAWWKTATSFHCIQGSSTVASLTQIRLSKTESQWWLEEVVIMVNY